MFIIEYTRNHVYEDGKRNIASEYVEKFTFSSRENALQFMQACLNELGFLSIKIY